MNFFAYVKWLIAVWKKKFSLWRKRRSWSFQSSLRFQLPKCMFCFSNAICDHNPINHKSYWSSRYLYLCTYTRAPIRAKINQCHFGESRLFVMCRTKYALTFAAGQKNNQCHGTVALARWAPLVIYFRTLVVILKLGSPNQDFFLIF